MQLPPIAVALVAPVPVAADLVVVRHRLLEVGPRGAAVRAGRHHGGEGELLGPGVAPESRSRLLVEHGEDLGERHTEGPGDSPRVALKIGAANACYRHLSATMGEMAAQELTTLHSADQAALLSVPQVSAVTRAYLEAAQAAATRRAYRADWRHFAAWCADRAVDALPATPETVADYVADSAAGGSSASTIGRRLAAVRSAHLAAGHPVSPTSAALVRTALAGVRRTHGVAPLQKAAITTAEMRALVGTLDPTTPLGARDRAILLLGYATGMRRSELAALDVDDLEFVADAGLRIRMRRSKTDQEARGRLVGVLRGRSAETCAVQAVQAWLEQPGRPETSPLLLHVRRGGHITAERISAKVVAMVVQRTALAAGLDPSRLGGHSLRAGMVTTATRNRAPLARVMAQSGHVRLDTLMGYVREVELFDDNASGYLGL